MSSRTNQTRYSVEYNKHRILKLHSWLALKPVDKLLTRRVGVRYGGSQPLKDMQAPRTASYRPDKYILNYFIQLTYVGYIACCLVARTKKDSKRPHSVGGPPSISAYYHTKFSSNAPKNNYIKV